RGGRGVLLGGVPGVPPADVVIIGAGNVGAGAARITLGMGANVTLIDINIDRLRYLQETLHGNLITVMSNRFNIERAVKYADLLIGAVLVPGARAPRLVTEDMVKQMKPGSVIVDVAIDQGGCIETADRVTTHDQPTYVKHGVIHYAVSNMPGAVPRTSTMALTNATLPYVLKLANYGFEAAVRADRALARGVNCFAGRVTQPGVAEAHGLEYTPLQELLCPRPPDCAGPKPHAVAAPAAKAFGWRRRGLPWHARRPAVACETACGGMRRGLPWHAARPAVGCGAACRGMRRGPSFAPCGGKYMFVLRRKTGQMDPGPLVRLTCCVAGRFRSAASGRAVLQAATHRPRAAFWRHAGYR